ncbi:hypothetical protein [Sulfuriroseicoccus oceanibius]|uniref:Uncharacterized protein n=1 Tax=Sulfuriroseicoccus oceanibius TaxID=2707525 RepID=A0A6B3L8B7_9BACT|nr:hypothetical protein [Sulfuriroseicoccus oceanibius]QQL43677.1 hypothetical protein G3M56_007120 [Sulfuriroseicoccus oceanibius]
MMSDLPLRCPITHTKLTAASGDTLARINLALAAGQLEQVIQVDGVKINGKLEAAWINEAGTHAYPDQQGIPVLVPDAAILLDSHAS